MKSENYHFQWFTKEDARKALRVSISKDGKIRIGQGLRKRLPPYIQVGFDIQSRVLAIADGTDTDILWPRTGIFNMGALAAQITSLGLSLPVSFRMEVQSNGRCYYGTVIPYKRRGGRSGKPEYDMEQLMALYHPVIDTLIYQVAKTMPLAERKSCAWEAFCQAVNEYTPSHGDLDRYLHQKVRTVLITENKAFVRTFRDRSMDAPLTNHAGEPFCLYDVTPDESSTDIDMVEEKIVEEQFVGRLSPKERRLYEMACSGSPVSEIAKALGIGEDEVQTLGRTIGGKRSSFYNGQPYLCENLGRAAR